MLFFHFFHFALILTTNTFDGGYHFFVLFRALFFYIIFYLFYVGTRNFNSFHFAIFLLKIIFSLFIIKISIFFCVFIEYFLNNTSNLSKIRKIYAIIFIYIFIPRRINYVFFVLVRHLNLCQILIKKILIFSDFIRYFDAYFF